MWTAQRLGIVIHCLLGAVGVKHPLPEVQSALTTISQGNHLSQTMRVSLRPLLDCWIAMTKYDAKPIHRGGLQRELTRSVSLQYPKSIAQTVSLVETTEMAVKASTRPCGKINTTGLHPKGPNQSNWGQ